MPCTCVCSVVSDSAIPWTVACWAPLSMQFPWQEYWSGLPFPPPGDLPYSGMEPVSLASSALEVGSLPLHHLDALEARQFIFLCFVNFALWLVSSFIMKPSDSQFSFISAFKEN